MFDKLDLRVPDSVDFTSEFRHLRMHTIDNEQVWSRGQYYEYTAHLDMCGVDAVVHVGCRMTDRKNHKIEILRCGEKTYDDYLEVCKRVFDADPEQFGVMRVDLTADVPDVPVDWFKRHTSIRAKQTRRELGTVEPYQTVRKGRAETLYGGQKPNQIRIYDKVGERRARYQSYLRQFERSSKMLTGPIPAPTSFLQMYGHESDAMITRVERQVSSKDAEKLGITTLRSLLMADNINPFEQILFFDHRTHEPQVADWGFTDYNVGMNLQTRVREFGVSETLAWMKQVLGDKNFYREKKKYAPFLRITDNVVGIDAAKLKGLYASSTYKQLLRAA